MEEYVDITQDGGIKKIILTPGTGANAIKGKKVSVHYKGTFENGQEFDSSVRRNKPFSFTLGGGEVISGWDIGVETMKIGEKAKFKLAPKYAYGSRGAGNVIPPNSTLIFEVEFLSQ